MKLRLTDDAMEDLAFWKKADRRVALKIASLLAEIAETPYTGRGRPEALRFGLSGCWSRRINMRDRIVYSVDEQAGVVTVLALRRHYGG